MKKLNIVNTETQEIPHQDRQLVDESFSPSQRERAQIASVNYESSAKNLSPPQTPRLSRELGHTQSILSGSGIGQSIYSNSRGQSIYSNARQMNASVSTCTTYY